MVTPTVTRRPQTQDMVFSTYATPDTPISRYTLLAPLSEHTRSGALKRRETRVAVEVSDQGKRDDLANGYT